MNAQNVRNYYTADKPKLQATARLFGLKLVKAGQHFYKLICPADRSKDYPCKDTLENFATILATLAEFKDISF